MKARFSELALGSCFVSSRGKGVKKKLEGAKVVSVTASGRYRTRSQRGDPEVSAVQCPLHMIGAGLRRFPQSMVEIGDGRPVKRTDRRLGR